MKEQAAASAPERITASRRVKEMEQTENRETDRKTGGARVQLASSS